MNAEFEIGGNRYKVDMDSFHDLSISVSTREDQVNAYYARPVKMDPYKSGEFVGEVARGGSVNYRDISFNPHGNGTHTECVGHITEQVHSVNHHFQDHWQLAQLISCEPKANSDGDLIVNIDDVNDIIGDGVTALIIRTLPNDESKLSRQYSGSNPPYLSDHFISKIVAAGIQHILVDLPSLDKEVDSGKLLGHKAFWFDEDEASMNRTITELIFVRNELEDGIYLLNLQVAPFENDAAPSRPLIYPVLQ